MDQNPAVLIASEDLRRQALALADEEVGNLRFRRASIEDIEHAELRLRMLRTLHDCPTLAVSAQVLRKLNHSMEIRFR